MLGIAAFRNKVRTFISESHWWGTLVTNPKQALRDLGPGGNPATKNDLDDAAKQILAELRELRAEKQARGKAQPLDAAEEQRTEEAVREVLVDPGLPARAAADAMREGRVAEAFRILRRDAETGAAETAERWRRLGALARGIDTRQSLEAYEAAFCLQPSDFGTCIELCRLRVQAGNIAGAQQAALAAQAAATTDRESSVAYNDSGNVQVAQGRLDAALESFRASHAIFERRAAGDPGNAEWQRDLSVSHIKIGDVQVAQGELRAALVSFRASHAIAERLAAADPGNAGWQRDLSVSLEKIGEVQVAQGDRDAALESFQASLAIRERLAAAAPGHAGWQRDLSVSREKIGDVQVAQGDLGAALVSFRASHAIFERLAAADPGNAEWQRDLSVSHERIGDMQLAQGDLDGALESFRADLAIAERLAAADPGNAGWQRDLSVSHERLGDVQVAQGNLGAALESFRASQAIFERLAAADPGNAEWQRDLIVSYAKLAETEPSAGWWVRGFAMAEKLAAEGRLAPQDQWMVEDLREKAQAEAAQ